MQKSIDHDACKTESNCLDNILASPWLTFRRLFKKRADNIFQASVVAGRKTTLEHRTQSGPIPEKEPEITFRASDIARQNHSALTIGWKAFAPKASTYPVTFDDKLTIRFCIDGFHFAIRMAKFSLVT